MFKGFLIFILIIVGLLPVLAQQSPNELGIRIFDLFKNESYSFKELIPTESQLIDKVESKDPELIKYRINDFKKEYPKLVKRFNQKCEDILEEGVAKGIVWNEIELITIKQYTKNIGLKYEDHSATVEITKLCVYFSSNQREFVLIFNAVVEYDGQYLVSNDAIEVEEVIK